MNKKVSGGVNARGALIAAACVVITGSYALPAHACGMHDPTLFAQGIMNHVYPNALYVNGAISRARRAGYLPPPDMWKFKATGDERKLLDQLAFGQTLSALHALGVEIEKQAEENRPAVSLVVLNTMLWVRYSSDYSDVNQGLHVKGPAAGDVVMVTDEPVIRSIEQGLLSLAKAVELGVVRLYGDEQRQEELLAQVGAIGESPLPRSGLPAMFLAGSLEAAPSAMPTTTQPNEDPRLPTRPE